jgi:predicted ATPase/class 3 adenylate cyclase
MSVRPTGTITFLFSDIEGSSRKWEQQPAAMRVALATHDRLLREAFEAQDGYVFKTVGDAFCVAFDTAQDALTGALEAQRALRMENWESIGELNVRMALHTGAAEQRDGDYFGQSLNRVSRILAAAHGGQVLLSLPTQELVRDLLPMGVQLRHLGEHRLRDLARPEQLFQLIASDLPSQFPALRSLESVPNNLPVQLTSFVGREREMTEVKRLLASTRLLTLTGTGGTGKTRLSLQVAADLFDRFHDGVWFVEFATIDDASLVVETVAGALELRQEAERPLSMTLTSFLRSKQLLLILDNCEHVVAACARLAEALLRACPSLRVLASSREPLGIAGETAWPLPPLSLPDHWRELTAGPDAIERLSQYEAVRLFIDRATIVRPAFQLSNENVHLVAQICWRLDGIALAIELAAARIRVLTLQQIVERLDDRFHLLTTGSRTAVPRQQTLRSLIDWSYDLLSEPERQLLRRLSVFARGRTLEAIEAVCSGDGLEAGEIIDLLSQLVDKSLVSVEKTPEFGARYFVLESIWDYAHEKLVEAGEGGIFRQRHLDYFLRFVEDAAPKIRGGEQREWLGRVEQEDINLRFAVETSEELPGQISKGLRLLTAAQRFIEVRGLFKETRDVFARLLAHPDAAPRDAIRARALAAAGRLAWVSDNLSECREEQEEALSIFRELGEAGGTAMALVDLGFLALDAGDPSQARALIDEAGALAETLGDARVSAHLRHTRAALAAAEGDFSKAFDLEDEALALYRQAGDAWQALIVVWSLGMNAALLGRFDAARAHFAECLQVGLALGNRWGASYPLEAFAALAVAERRYDRAARLFGAAEAQRNRSGMISQGADHPALLRILANAPDFTGPVVDAARNEGRALSFDAAVELALEIPTD